MLNKAEKDCGALPSAAAVQTILPSEAGKSCHMSHVTVALFFLKKRRQEGNEGKECTDTVIFVPLVLHYITLRSVSHIKPVTSSAGYSLSGPLSVYQSSPSLHHFVRFFHNFIITFKLSTGNISAFVWA